MRKLLVILLLSVCGSTVAVGQNMEFVKYNFHNKKAYKEAVKNLKQGDKLFYAKNPDYSQALNYYYVAQNINPYNAKLNYKIGKCLYYEYKDKAKPYLFAADGLWNDLTHDSLMVSESSYMLADVYKSELIFDSAVYYFRKAAKYDYTHSINTLIDKEIRQCLNNDTIIRHPEKVFVDLLPVTINSDDNDYLPVLINYYRGFVFNSDRKNNVSKKSKLFNFNKNKKPTNKFYYCDIINKNDYGTVNEYALLGSLKDEDVVTDISFDGKFCLIIRNGDIYVSSINGTELSRPKKLPQPVNSRDEEAFACFNKNMHYIYFVSDRSGGKGGKDIYRVSFIIYKGDNFRFSDKVENLGENINTEYDEISVSLLPFDNAMYFCSNRMDALGGFDVFVSLPDEYGWLPAKNLGYPLNTPDDELYYYPVRDSRHGYLTRRVDYNDANIYRAEFVDFDNKMLIKTYDDALFALSDEDDLKTVSYEPELVVSENVIVSVSGRFIDKDTHEPVGVSVRVYDLNTMRIKASFVTHAQTGRYRIPLPSGADYLLALSGNDDYLFCQKILHVEGSTTPQSYELDIELQKTSNEALINLENLVFVPGTAEGEVVIDEEASFPVIALIVMMLQGNDNVSLVIVGNESKAVQFGKQLVINGISSNKLSYQFVDEHDSNVSIKILKEEILKENVGGE